MPTRSRVTPPMPFSRCLVLMAFVTLALGQALAWAEDPVPASASDWKGLLMMLVPVIWGAVAPMVLAVITKSANGLMGAYVPRPLQVLVSAILGAVAVGVTGDLSSTAGATSAIGAAVTGGTAQVYAGLKPATLLTTPPPVTLGGPVT